MQIIFKLQDDANKTPAKYYMNYIIFLELDLTDQINKLRRQKEEGYDFIVIWRELKGTRPMQTL
jgi:hypothetical protein